MHLSRYLKIYPSKSQPGSFLLFSTLRAATVLVPAAILKAAQEGSLDGPERETLARTGMLVADPEKEREQMLTLLDHLSQQSRSLKLTVTLNLDCNLDCIYCFEGGFRGELYMSEATADLLVETLIRDYMSKGWGIGITFYGGEPLLSQDLIGRISLPLKEAAERHQVTYSFGMVTNGTLLNRETALGLLPLGFKSAKFTLDGPREIHDRQRPFASGSGSFEAIVDNIASVCDLIEVQLGGNFYQENYREFPRLLDHLISCGIAPGSFTRLQFTPITPQAGCAEYSSGCMSSSDPWLFEALPFLREEILRRGFPTPKPAPSACIVELANTLVVSYDGALYKCPSFMGNSELKIGSLSEGIGDYSKSHSLGNWKTEECLDCAYLPICFGGCRFMTQLQGRPFSEVDCKREFLDATLETLILQNMAYPAKKVTPPPQSAQ